MIRSTCCKNKSLRLGTKYKSTLIYTETHNHHLLQARLTSVRSPRQFKLLIVSHSRHSGGTDPFNWQWTDLVVLDRESTCWRTCRFHRAHAGTKLCCFLTEAPVCTAQTMLIFFYHICATCRHFSCINKRMLTTVRARTANTLRRGRTKKGQV